MEKTIVFCVNMDHALDVRQLLQNHFAHLGSSGSPYGLASAPTAATTEGGQFSTGAKGSAFDRP